MPLLQEDEEARVMLRIKLFVRSRGLYPRGPGVPSQSSVRA
jgi:hypothetical protein